MRYHSMTVFFFLVGCLFIGIGYAQDDASGDGVDLEAAQHDNGEPAYQENRPAFYPSFPSFESQPQGHSRPFYYQPEAAYSHRPQGAYHQQLTFDSPRYTGYKAESRQAVSAASENVGLLGSGNFGVIRGGTFYNENDGDYSSGFGSDYNSFFQNGHGRPSFNNYGSNQNPRPYQHEQFANFRDFADINTPSSPSFSHFVVVYANKNGTPIETQAKLNENRPKNIIESLALIDNEYMTTTEVPVKKLSKAKRKLALLPLEKKPRYKKAGNLKSNELKEPLLALS